MKAVLLLLCVVLFQDQIPFKPNEEFELKLNFEFKERTKQDPNTVELDQNMRRSRGSGPLPYLFLNLRVLKQAPTEVRVKVLENGTSLRYSKKVDLATIIKLDLGFTDDIKDRVSPYEYTIQFFDAKKEPVSKVVVFFQEDGTYLVNGQVRGKL